MVSYFIYATDDSKSTYGNDYFNSRGLDTLRRFKEEVQNLQNSCPGDHKDDRIVYLHWSHRCVKVEEDEVVSRYSQKSGEGTKTLPQTVLTWMAKNLQEEDAIQLLYVITDGVVYPSDSDTRPIDPRTKIDNVTFYAFNSNVKNIDMSVASMFMCTNIRYIVYCNDELVDDTDLANPFDYNQITIKNFKDKKKQLKSFIKLQFLTKKATDQMALDEIKKLKCLQSRLNSELAAAETKEPINLNVKDKVSFINEFKKTIFYKTLMNPDHYDAKQDIANCIGTLINYINNDKKSFQFDSLKIEQKFVPIEEEESLNVNYKIEKEIEFPDIILANETGIPVILLTRHSVIQKILYRNGRSPCSLLFSDKALFSRFRKTIDCPLFLLLDNLLRDSIEYYYNLEAFKGMVENGIQTGPRTRNKFIGAIVPLEEFDDYNDYVLSCTYFERRRVPYNKGLFYYVLYKTCERLEYIEPNVVEYFKEYVIKRIAKTKCPLSLSKVSTEDPVIRVDLTTALWYCLELSSTIFKNDAKHFTKEKMRMYSSYADYMIEILEWYHYDIDTSSVYLRAEIYKNVNSLKRIPGFAFKAKFLLEQIFEKKDDFLIAELVNPENIYKFNYLLMDHNTVIDESLLSTDIDMHRYAHFMNHLVPIDVPVCKETMRPYFVTEDKHSFYEHLMMRSRQVSVQNEQLILEPVNQLDFTRVLSVNKLYISYVKKFKKFPTIYEFKWYVYEKKRYFNGKPVIFGKHTLEIIGNTFENYDKIINDQGDPIDVARFIKIAKSSANRQNRIKKENPLDFDVDSAVNFIKLSERNVKLHDENRWFCVML